MNPLAIAETDNRCGEPTGDWCDPFTYAVVLQDSRPLPAGITLIGDSLQLDGDILALNAIQTCSLY